MKTTPHNISITLVESWKEAEAFRSWMRSSTTPIAVDTETTGFEVASGKDYPRLVQIGDKDTVYCLPEPYFGAIHDVWGSRQTKVFHNAKFDQHALRNGELPIAAWEYLQDTMVLSRLTNPLESASLKGLTDTHISATGKDAQKGLNKALKDNNWGWDTVPVQLKEYWVYGGLDVAYTSLLYNKLSPKVPSSVKPILDLEMAIMPILWNAEQQGVVFNQEEAAELEEELLGSIETLQRQLEKEYKLVEPTKPSQVIAALLAEGATLIKKTAGGAWSTDKEALEAINSPLSELLLNWRYDSKMLATYVQGMSEKAAFTGRLHASFNQIQAKTGRFSMSAPNLQNIPAADTRIRQLIVPAPGNAFVGADWSQVELRLVACLSKDPTLLEDINSPKDFFCALASGIFKKEVEKGDEERSIAKTITYAKLYSAGPARIAAQSGVTLTEAREYVGLFDERYSTLIAYMNSLIAKAPYGQTKMGRPLRTTRGKEYAMANATVQGLAADLMKSAIHNLYYNDLESNFRITIHDEVVLEVPIEEAEEAAQDLKKVMEAVEFGAEALCGFPAEPSIAYTLADLK